MSEHDDMIASLQEAVASMELATALLVQDPNLGELAEQAKKLGGRITAALAALSDKTLKPKGFMLKVGGKVFHCACQCNVFVRLDALRFECAICGKTYEGTK